MFIQRLTIIGVGLIGGSLARALRRQQLCGEIVGCSRDVNHLQQAIDLGVIDRYVLNPALAVRDADMIVVAVPLGAMPRIFTSLSTALSLAAIITDVGSAKAGVIATARQHLGQHFPQFVPAHPIAGTEHSGVAASFAELFEKHRVILTPVAETLPAAVAKVTAMWTYTGAEVVNMDPAHHDEVLAATSHLPHVLAYSLVDTLAQLNERKEIFRFAAGGFRDFTRIASSDPTMWHDICLANKTAILKILAQFSENLAELAQVIEQEQGEALREIFTRAKVARDQFLIQNCSNNRLADK